MAATVALDGSVGFDARVPSGIPLTKPYSKSPTDTNRIAKGSPLIKSGATDRVTTPAVAAGGLSLADKLIGFAVTKDRATAAGELNAMFAQFIGPNQPPSGEEQILVHEADAITEFTMALDPAQIAALSLQGTVAGLKQQPNGQWTIDITNVTHTPISITKIHPSDIGLAGGRVDFKVPFAASQYLNGN